MCRSRGAASLPVRVRRELACPASVPSGRPDVPALYERIARPLPCGRGAVPSRDDGVPETLDLGLNYSFANFRIKKLDDLFDLFLIVCPPFTVSLTDPARLSILPLQSLLILAPMLKSPTIEAASLR